MRLIRFGALAVALSLAIAQPVAAIGPGSSGVHAPLYYLSLGDSLAVGVQPTGDPADLWRTDDGYADQLYGIAKAWYPNLTLVKLGCPGETTWTMVDGGICTYDHGSQLAEAVAFLHAHQKFVAFVSIDIGVNDFPCQTGLACVPPGVATISANLPRIVGALRDAAGPETVIVGATMYDPFLGYWLSGPEGQAFAQLSVSGAIVPLNQLLTGIYGAAGMPVADVEGAFSTTDFTTMVPMPPVGLVPLNVARICQWTWICAPAPLGPDNHANAAGYHAIAEAFATVLEP
ncbi:MAG TPA: SGNH/GDSL hydrolase family protein [Candidatus Limnocylindrales bacterium]|nr:SGNH/GDSL hydrolase family protein [Candidatus Limnocylindrales bacterium]